MPLFLADESCDFAVVRALRSAGYDVTAICELAPQTQDPDVIALAAHERRVLITEDKDFGQLVYAELRESSGVVLIRFPASERKALPAAILEVVQELGDRLIGAFVVLTPRRVRIGRAPRGQDQILS
jgi:predicted nuclease of predicted toxin-antitoxin system